MLVGCPCSPSCSPSLLLAQGTNPALGRVLSSASMLGSPCLAGPVWVSLWLTGLAA